MHGEPFLGSAGAQCAQVAIGKRSSKRETKKKKRRKPNTCLKKKEDKERMKKVDEDAELRA